MIMLLENCKTNHIDPHNPCLHCVQLIFQKISMKFSNMFSVQLRNTLLRVTKAHQWSIICKETFKNEQKELHENTNQ